MLNSLKKLFLPAEVKATLYALKQAQQECDNSAFGILWPSLEAQVLQKEKTVHSIVIDGISPNQLAHLLITNVLQSVILSGAFHVYRGVLNNTGRDLLRIWDYAVKKLETLGYHTPEEASKDHQWIREQVQNVG